MHFPFFSLCIYSFLIQYIQTNASPSSIPYCLPLLPNSIPLDPLLHCMFVFVLLGFLTWENKELKKLDNNKSNNQIIIGYTSK